MDNTRRTETKLYKHAGTTPDYVLKAALSTMPELAERTEQLFARHPRARPIATALAGYMTNAIPVHAVSGIKAKQRVIDHNPSKSLLAHCLRSGVNAWDQGEAKLETFLAGLFQPIPLLATWQAYVGRSRQTKTWDFCSGPLHTWMSAHCSTPFIVQRPTIVSPPLADQAVRALVASRVLEPMDFELIGYKLQAALPQN